jgi:hypothetical protein
MRPRLDCTCPGLNQVTSDGNTYFLCQIAVVGVALGLEHDNGWTRRVAGTGEFVSSQTQFVVTVEVGVVGERPQCTIWTAKGAGKAVGRRAFCRDCVVDGGDMHRREFA